MKRWRRLIALPAVLAMTLAACGGDPAEDTVPPADDTVVDDTVVDDTVADDTVADDTVADDTPDTTMAPGGDIATDVGVDLEAGTINVGLLSDLSGPFAPLVQAIVTGHEVYWEDVNAAGGINGLMVNLIIEDNAYDVPTHLQKYEEIRDEIVALGHSTGSPHTVAALPEYIADDMLAVPLTWYSGWTDPAFSSNLMHHGSPYCIEAMNAIEWISNELGGATTIAIASVPGDYGLDGAAGAAIAAEALGLDVVYDGSGAANPADEASLTEIANGIAGSGAEIVFFSATPGAFSSVYGQALAQGFEAKWTGTSPSFSPAFVAPDSPIRDGIARDMINTTYVDSWDGESAGAQEFTALIQELRPDAPPLDYYNEGYVEAKILHDTLLAAYDSGDMTRAGVLAAAKSLENVEFNGLAAPESYVGTPNEQLQRASNIFVPDLESPTGSSIVEYDYVSAIAADYQFDEACYSLEG